MDSLKNIIAQRAIELRKDSTEAEAILWEHLRSRQFCGLKFRRQEAIGKFIADFVCFEEKIIIEVDGKPHETQKERDAERDAWLEGQGFIIARYWNEEVLQNIESVLQKIKAIIPPRPCMGEGAGGEGLARRGEGL